MQKLWARLSSGLKSNYYSSTGESRSHDFCMKVNSATHTHSELRYAHAQMILSIYKPGNSRQVLSCCYKWSYETAVGDSSVAERRRWSKSCQTGKSVHEHTKQVMFDFMPRECAPLINHDRTKPIRRRVSYILAYMYVCTCYA